MPVCILLYLAAYKLSGKDLRACNGILICEGLFFYWWAEPKLLLFFVVMPLLIYSLGDRIYKTESAKDKKALMIYTVAAFILLLVAYKHLPSLRVLSPDGQYVRPPVLGGVLLPIGISFFVLEAISYIADIYTGKMMPGNVMDAFVFMTFFPKASCGPIVLWRDFAPQIHDRRINSGNIIRGINRLIIGFAKKAVIADTFAAQISLINLKLTTYSTDSLSVWILAILYFFRIYYDFAGYSDIAIGLSSIFGFEIGENFDRPYLAASLTDFWRKWHMSLYRFLKEYLYIPLGGNRTKKAFFNIFLVFMLSGLWYGWRLPVLIWAALDGLIVIAEKKIYRKTWYKKIPEPLRIIATMFIVCMGWLLFRAPNIADAGLVFKGLFISPGGRVPNFTWRFFMTRRITVFLVIAAAGVFGIPDKLTALLKNALNSTLYDIIEKLLLLALFALSIMFVLSTSYIPFIF